MLELGSVLKHQNLSRRGSLITHRTGGDRSQFHTTVDVTLFKNATIGRYFTKVNKYFGPLMLPLP